MHLLLKGLQVFYFINSLHLGSTFSGGYSKIQGLHWVGGTLKAHLVQLPCSKHGHLQL